MVGRTAFFYAGEPTPAELAAQHRACPSSIPTPGDVCGSGRTRISGSDASTAARRGRAACEAPGTAEWSWSMILIPGASPCPRFRHATTASTSHNRKPLSTNASRPGRKSQCSRKHVDQRRCGGPGIVPTQSRVLRRPVEFTLKASTDKKF